MNIERLMADRCMIVFLREMSPVVVMIDRLNRIQRNSRGVGPPAGVQEA